MQRLRYIVVAIALTAGCAANAPPSLTPVGIRAYQANEALLVLGTVQRSAIELNGIQKCATPPSTDCAPLLSTPNTKLVVDTVAGAVMTIRAVPDGWKATTSKALQEIGARLDAAGKTKFGTYLSTAATLLDAIGLVS